MDKGFDWTEAWKRHQEERRHADDREFWNQRAPSFAKTAGTSPYARRFLENAGVRIGQTVFDMGCGSGTLALPLAQQGIEVWACDFSPVMLELMMRRARMEGIDDLIHPLCLAWDEDWDAVQAPVCDFAFASRSVATSDLRAALTKLDSKAGQRVCITLGVDASPRSDPKLLEVIGRKSEPVADYMYGMNILWQMGVQPELSYIRSRRSAEFHDFDEAIEKTCAIIEATPAERELLEAYSREHLVPSVDRDGNPCLSYDHVRVTSWAFISWDKGEPEIC